MKKTLIALAAVAVTSTAFAQNVTISGRIDAGTVSSKTTGSKDQTTAKSDVLTNYNTNTTSRITFAGTEDLGGGLTAFFNAESGLNKGSFGDRNLFVGVRGSFGSVQAGRYLNSFSAIRDAHISIGGGAGGGFLNRVTGFDTNSTVEGYGLSNKKTFAFAAATTTVDTAGFQPTAFYVASSTVSGVETYTQLFASSTAGVETKYTANGIAVDISGTASGTPATAAELDALNTANRASNAAAQDAIRSLMIAYSTRSDNALAYTTPKIGDFTLTVGISDSKITSDRVGRTGENKANVSSQSYSLAYASGPLAARLTVGSGKVTQSSQFSPASGTAAEAAAQGDTKVKASENALLVSYDLGVAQAHVMHNNTKSTLQSVEGTANGSTRKTSATEIGVKMPMGAYEPFVTVGRGDVKTTNKGVANTSSDVKASSYQLGVNYNLSKRTRVYASTGQHKFKTTANTAKTTGYTFGLVHNF